MALFGGLFASQGGNSPSTSVSSSTALQSTATTSGGTSIQGNSNRVGDNTTFGNISANTTAGSNNTVTASGSGQVTYNTYNGSTAADTLGAIGNLFSGVISSQGSPASVSGTSGGGGGFFSSLTSPQDRIWVIAGVVIAGLSLLFLLMRKKS